MHPTATQHVHIFYFPKASPIVLTQPAKIDASTQTSIEDILAEENDEEIPNLRPFWEDQDHQSQKASEEQDRPWIVPYWDDPRYLEALKSVPLDLSLGENTRACSCDEYRASGDCYCLTNFS